MVAQSAAVLPSTSVLFNVSPLPKMAPAHMPLAGGWLLAMVQLSSVPVGLLLSQSPPPLLPKAVFSAMVTLVI